jgi:hypothetical protein
LWIIFLGIINYVSYTIAYGYIGGDARNGCISSGNYYVRGHFIHIYKSPSGKDAQVSKAMWIYSYIHSITIPPTMAAIILGTLILARPHIIATMREGFISGQTIITIFSTTVALVAGAMTIWFILDFIYDLRTAG